MKRYALSLAVLLLLLLALVAVTVSCGGKGQEPTDTTTDTEAETDTAPVPDAETESQPEASTDTDTPDTQPDTQPETQPVPATVSVPYVYPTPKEITVPCGSEAPAVDASTLTLSGDASAYAEVLTRLELPVGENGLRVTVSVSDLSDTCGTCADEGYILRITEDGVSVIGGSDRGVYYALQTLAQLWADGALPAVTVTDAPAMPIRGVIEGFYGVAWTHEYRLSLFAFLGNHKMNTYMYAPKDDPKHRAQWRSTYTGAELRRMQELIDTAKENRVRFVYAISPGLDIDLGSGYDKDFAALCKKCESLYELGVRDFAILLDDIPTLNAAGHAKLLNDFEEQFCKTHEGVSDLIAITTEFCDAMLTAYTQELAPLLHDDIVMMWTGTGVVPASVTASQLKNINRIYGRKMLIWWNYPVNDVLTDHLYMDAACGLSSDLDTAVTGLLSNPMNQGHASFIPLFTTADYLWNPSVYQPDASLEAACRSLYPEIADALLTFIDLTGASPMNGNRETVKLGKLLEQYTKNRTDPELARTLKEALQELVDAAQTIRAKGDPALVSEIAAWVDKMEAYGLMGQYYADMELEAAGENRTEVLLAQLDGYCTAAASVASNKTSVSPGTLTTFYASLSPRINRMLGFDSSGSSDPIGLSTDMTTYQDYVLENAGDGNTETFYWSAGAPNIGSYIQINLGSARKVDLIRLRSGVGGHPDDYMHVAELMYSVDGTAWTSLGSVTAPSFDKKVDITAQYIRLVCRATQIYWVTVSDFSAVSTASMSDMFSMDTSFAPELSLLALTDGSVTTAFCPDPAGAAGHTLTVSTVGFSSMRMIITGLPETDGLTVTAYDAAGNVIRTYDPTRDYVIDCTGVDHVTVTFGKSAVRIGEIILT